MYDLGDGEGADVVDMDSQLMWRPHNVEVQLKHIIDKVI